MSHYLLDVPKRDFGPLYGVSKGILWQMYQECLAEVLACHPDAQEGAARRNGLEKITDQLKANGQWEDAA